MPKPKSKRLTHPPWMEDRRFRALIENSLDGIGLLDAEGLQLYASPSVTRILGYTADVLIGTSAFDLVHPDDVRAAQETLDELVRQPRSTAQVLIRLRHQNGAWRWIEARAKNLLHEPDIAAVVVNYRDVTERREAEEQTREIERRLRVAMEGGRMGAWEADLQAGEVRWFLKSETHFGLPEGTTSWPLEQFFQLLHPEDRERIREEFHQCMARQINLESEFRVVWPDGSVRWLFGLGQPIVDSNGQAVRLYGVGRDITARKQAEEALRESERRFQVLASATFEGIAVTEHGRIVDANEQLTKMLGYSRHELIGLEVAALVVPEDRERVLANIREGRESVIEHGIMRKDGSRLTVEAHGRTVPHQGRSVRYSAIRDITERKQASETLRQTEARYRSIVETAEEGIWVVDRDWRITFVNPRLTQMLGYTAEEMLGHPITDFMDDEERRAAPGHMRLREQGQRSTHDSRFRRKDGTVLWAIVAGSPLLDDAGRFTGALALIADITERKRTEEQLRESSEALETLSRRLLEVQETERQGLARELHDEVGQSLTLLKLAVDRCRQVELAEVPTRLEQAQTLLGDLVRRVRNMSLDLRPSMLDDLGLLPALLWQFDRYRSQTRIEVLFTQSGLEGRRLGPHVETAAFRIVQEALTNVARHADVRRLSVHLSADETLLRVQVQDDGRGFDVEAALGADVSVGLRGMFERARLLGGKLQINSDPGAGTFLSAELPLRAPGPRPDAVAPGNSPSPPDSPA